MIRTLTAVDFNRIARHPDVLPWLAFNPPMAEPDLGPSISNPRNFAFLTPRRDGGYIFYQRQQNLFEIHTLAEPSARGRAMLELASQAFDFLFSESPALEIVTGVPDGNDRAKTWALHFGFRETMRREKSLLVVGEMVGVQYMSLTYGDWALRSKMALQLGCGFHALLEESGVHDQHPEDSSHDQWVGATLMGCIGHNAVKAINLYNRNACFTGYRQIDVVTWSPLVLDIGSALVELSGKKLTVLHVSMATTSSAPPATGIVISEGPKTCQ